SSRRRHTRFSRDWSSDVCSSDLDPTPPADLSPPIAQLPAEIARHWSVAAISPQHFLAASPRVQLVPQITDYVAGIVAGSPSTLRSEERRVGKEWRSRWSAGQDTE